MARWTASVSSGRRAPNEKNTCRPGSRRQGRDRPAQEQLCARPRCRAGRCRTTSKPPVSSAGSGWRRSCWTRSTLDAGAGRLLADPVQHVGVGVDHREPPDAAGGLPVQAAKCAIATETRSSSPSSRMRWPASACASCIRSTRLQLGRDGAVRLIEFGLGRGRAVSGRLHNHRQAVQSAGISTPAPAAGGTARPDGRSPGDGRDRGPAVRGEPDRTRASTTPRLRSSLQAAATIGTGSSASLATSRTAAGSASSTADRMSRMPASPSARPTAAATSATTVSTSMSCVFSPPRWAGSPAAGPPVRPALISGPYGILATSCRAWKRRAATPSCAARKLSRPSGCMPSMRVYPRLAGDRGRRTDRASHAAVRSGSAATCWTLATSFSPTARSRWC